MSDRDMRGRFVRGNRYRFRLTEVNGFSRPFLMQDQNVGAFCRATGSRKVR